MELKKDTHLNATLNRFGLNKKNRIGDLLEGIAISTPLTVEEWREYYFANLLNEANLQAIGAELHEKIRSVILAEIQAITLEDCQNYVTNLVFTKTFDGIRARHQILNAELVQRTGKSFDYLPDHPDDWRFKTYKIDYYHVDPVRDILIGIKVCPVSLQNSTDPNVVRALQEIRDTHRLEEERNAGQFFILFYANNRNGVAEVSNHEILSLIADI